MTNRLVEVPRPRIKTSQDSRQPRPMCACPPAYAFVCVCVRAHLLTRGMLTDWRRSSLLNAPSSACNVVWCFIVIPANVFHLQHFNCGLLHAYTHAPTHVRMHAREHVFTSFRHAWVTDDTTALSRQSGCIVDSIYVLRLRFVDAGVHTLVCVCACGRAFVWACIRAYMCMNIVVSCYCLFNKWCKQLYLDKLLLCRSNTQVRCFNLNVTIWITCTE